MASLFEDFDYLLQETSNDILIRNKLIKQKKDISIIKSKVFTTDTFVNKYYATKDLLNEAQRMLTASKEERKQICIDYNNSLDKCSKLEIETQRLLDINQELENKSLEFENRCGSIQAYNNQLQVLLKQNEGRLQTLKMENATNKTNEIRHLEKTIASLKKEKEVVTKHIHDILALITNKTFSGQTRKKIEAIKKIYFRDDTIFEVEDSEEDDDFAILSPTCNEVNETSILISDCSGGDKTNLKKDDRDSDGCQEVTSVDTGRGSSLAFSDSDKCFNSPDYFMNDSPLNVDIIHHKRKLVDASTSPIPQLETTSRASSPIHLLEEPGTIMRLETECRGSSPIPFIEEPPTQIVREEDSRNTKGKTNIPVINKSLNSINSIKNTAKPRSSLTINREIIACPLEFHNKNVGNTNNRDQRCLELNNSINLLDENSSDCEVETILNNMRMRHQLITPIPNTPTNSRTSMSNISQLPKVNFDAINEEMAKMRKLTEVIDTDLADLTNAFMSLENVSLISQLFSQEEVALNRKIFTQHEVIPDRNVLNAFPEISRTPSPIPIQNEDVSSLAPSNTPTPVEDTEYHIIESENSVSSLAPSNAPSPVEVTEYHIIVCDNNDSSLPPLSTRLPVEDAVRRIIESDSDFSSLTPTYLPNESRNLSPIPIQKEDVSNLPLSNTPIPVADTEYHFTECERNVSITTTEKNPVLNTSNGLSFEGEPKVGNKLQMKENVVNDPIEEVCYSGTKRTNKRKKLTKLEKFKNKMLPKSKIQRAHTPIQRKLRGRPKQFQPSTKKIANASAILNDKDVYEKAVRFMAELNSKNDAAKIKAALNCKRTQSADHKALDGNSSKTNLHNTTNGNEVRSDRLSKVASANNRVLPEISPSLTRFTRSRSKLAHNFPSPIVIVTRLETIPEKNINIIQEKNKTKADAVAVPENNKRLKRSSIDKPDEKNKAKVDVVTVPENNKRLKRSSIDKPDMQYKRRLRSSSTNSQPDNEGDIVNKESTVLNTEVCQNPNKSSTLLNNKRHQNEVVNNSRVVDYNDLDIFTNTPAVNDKLECQKSKQLPNAQDSILCKLLEKYGVATLKTCPKKQSEAAINSCAKKIEEGITLITELSPNDAKYGMNKLVDDICKWNLKHFLLGLLKYLSDPMRKIELFNKVYSPPAPAMTKPEQILIYIVTQLQGCWSGVDIVDCVLNNIEHALFRLNRTPEFNVIESMSHFYAVLCRYIKAKNRLRQFILDAMYCIHFKAVPLIKQCLDVWMHILPLAHMGIAKSPLVTCLVFLLHFFKCEDKFNRVQEIRNILYHKFFYQITEWSETKILDMFKNSIRELRDIPAEKKMLRMALIILAKRHGPRWCQTNIIKNMLLPIIEKEKVPERIKLFCVSIIGPLLKPYNIEMKVHCEIVINQLIDMLDQGHSHKMQEAIITSLIYMNKHNQNRIIQALLTWQPKQMSRELEELFKGYIRQKPVKVWKTILSKMSSVR